MDIHEDEIVTVDRVIETIETNVSEDVVVNDILVDSEPDNAISVKEYSFNLLPFKCRMFDFASARKTDLKNHKKTIHH